MPAIDESPEVTSLKRTATRHAAKVAMAQRGLTARRSALAKVGAALEEAIDEIRPPYLRYHIRRWLEMTVLLLLTIAEIVVAETVVQVLGLSATATYLVAAVVGITATALAWLIGHEWAVAHDPQAIAAGRRGWLGLAGATTAAFLAANLAVRISYGLLAEQADHLGGSLVAPLLAGSLLTVVTAALMVVAAFITAHAETNKTAELRKRLRCVRAELDRLDNFIGADSGSLPDGHLSVVEE